MPVAPACDVLETLVEVSILEVLGAHDTQAAASINDVVKLYDARGTVLFARPGGRHGTARVQRLVVGSAWAIVRHKLNSRDPDTVEDSSAALTCVSEDEVVGLGADDVPRIGVRATGANEIRVCAVLGGLRCLHVPP